MEERRFKENGAKNKMPMEGREMKGSLPVMVFAVMTVGLLLSIGCSTATTVARPTISDYSAQFHYTARNVGDGTKEVSIAIINPNWKVDANLVSEWAKDRGLFAQYGVQNPGDPESEVRGIFTKSLNADIEKLLTDKGFTLSGPFASLDEMTFPQKQQADLVLIPEIEMVVTRPKISVKAVKEGAVFMVSDGQTIYKYGMPANSTSSVSGYISFKVIEPLSGQKLWVKKVEFDNVVAACEPADDLTYDEGMTLVKNCMKKALERAYGNALGKADTYFNGQEMTLVKKQSKELRDKKVY